MDNKLISVIIPVYNSAAYLGDCLQSVCTQSYSNLEIILVDDGSNDGSADICDLWARKDTRIQIKHIENKGVSNARNIGLEIATGEYIAFLDADDILESNMMEKMLGVINEDIEILECGYLKFGNTFQENKKYNCHVELYDQITAIKYMYSCCNNKKVTWAVWGKLFHRNVIVGLRFPLDIDMAEDKWFMWQALLRIKKYAYLDMPLYHYRIHATSAMQNKMSLKNLSGYKVNEMIMDSARGNGKGFESIFYRQYIHTLVWYLLKMLALDPNCYHEYICDKQRYIRNNLGKIMSCDEYNYKFKLAIIGLILPINILIRLSCFIRWIMK